MDFRRVASFDFKWFGPAEATRLVEAAVRAGLVVETQGKLSATFDVQRVDVPVDFAPSPAVLDLAAGHVGAPRLVDVLAAEAGTTPEELEQAAATERERAQGLLAEETALLLAARRRGVDVRRHSRG